jgi:hypothetical protein
MTHQHNDPTLAPAASPISPIAGQRTGAPVQGVPGVRRIHPARGLPVPPAAPVPNLWSQVNRLARANGLEVLGPALHALPTGVPVFEVMPHPDH